MVLSFDTVFLVDWMWIGMSEHGGRHRGHEGRHKTRENGRYGAFFDNVSGLFWPVLGIKKDNSAVIRGLRIHHNFIRPHQDMRGDTPADRAGIRVQRNSKWLTIIQNAAQPRSTGAFQPE